MIATRMSIAFAMLMLAVSGVGAAEPTVKETTGAKTVTRERIDFKVVVLGSDPFNAGLFLRGEAATVVITGIPKPGFHTYPMTQKAPDQSPGQLSSWTWEKSNAIQPLAPVRESPTPEEHEIEGIGKELVYEHPFHWSQEVLILPDAKPGPTTIKFSLDVQVCNESCVRGKHLFEVTFDVSDQPAVALTNELEVRLEEARKASAAATSSGKEGDSSTSTGTAKDETKTGLFTLLGASMGAAFLMLLTPCVFPMIPITVSFFLKQSEKEHHNPLPTAAVYSGTIVVVLAFSVFVLGEIIVLMANSAWVNLLLGALLAYFALSLFGMYEIELPSFLVNFTSAREGQGGYAGAVFMALTFTITSFTCTGPFLGPLLVAVKETNISFVERLLGCFVYSGTFAAPFFVLALFPNLLKRLPKSGGWLNSVKVVMGFLELAAALKFLANTDLAFNPGNPRLFSYDSVLCAWIALSLCCGLYLLGVFRLPHDSPVETLGVGRMILASIFLGLAVYMVPAMWRITPQGVLGEGLVAFLPQDTRPPSSDAGGGGHGGLTWTRDYEAAWAQANREGKLLFVDFTGVNCTNCRYNENNIFTMPGVRDEMSKYVRVQLYTDNVPDPKLSFSESQRQGKRNLDIENGTFGDITLPLYAIIRPAKDAAFEQTPEGLPRLKGAVLGVRKGLIAKSKVEDFTAFLATPLRGDTHVARAVGE